MSLIYEPGRIAVTDENQAVRFDTDDRLFFATDFITGTLNIPQRSNNTLANYTHTLATCNALATRVLGAFQISFSGSPPNAGAPGFGWFNAGGTYVHYVDGSWGISQASTHGNVSRMSAYTFYCVGGELKLLEQIQLNNYDPFNGYTTFVQKAFTINYRLWLGAFDA